LTVVEMQQHGDSQQLSDRMSRRRFLFESGGGLGGIALASMMSDEGLLASTPGAEGSGVLGVPHHQPKAKRVVQFFMSGAASHIDLWDHKPRLIKDHGKKWDAGEPIELFQSSPGKTMRSPWGWQRYGKCGKQLSDVVAPLGACVDDMAFVHSMVGKQGVHSTATLLQATGFQTPGFPAMGSWISYGLGSMNSNLPAFVVLPDHRGFASNGTKNWSSSFLPAQHQGTIIRPGAKNPIADLFPGDTSYIREDSNRDVLSLIEKLNRKHESTRPGDSRLDARIRSYELAAQMQVSAPEALDISKEPQKVLELYGLPYGKKKFPATINNEEEIYYFGRKCLIARRLLERGVRFVQVWSGNDNRFPRRNWDSHEDINRDHGPLATGMAYGAAALLQDLKQRGMLDDTIVLWTTEFGRMPCSQGSKGRDHNPFVFSNWLAGGGIRGGITYGPSDEWGYKPLDRDNPTTVYDIHATILHLLGVDHERLTVRNNGIDRRLTDVHGHVIDELLV
jgi:hypothetical protein